MSAGSFLLVLVVVLEIPRKNPRTRTKTRTRTMAKTSFSDTVYGADAYCKNKSLSVHDPSCDSAAFRIAFNVENILLNIMSLKIESIHGAEKFSPARFWLCRLLLVMLAGGFAVSGRADTFVVTTTANNGPGSFQDAITNANANPGMDTIVFNILGVPPFTITPVNALPQISDPVTINATTQLGYIGKPVIELNGASTTGTTIGLRFGLGSDGSTLRGMAINRFPAQGIDISSAGSISIQGNFIGTDMTGLLARGNGGGNSSPGIYVKSSGNLIGGTNAGDGNLISGGNYVGIYFQNANSNVVQGNFIGLNSTGLVALGNLNNGILINPGNGNLIGGPFASARNVIAGNAASGVYLNGASAGNVIQGNRIGTDTSGSVAIGNATDGITLNGTPGNVICSNLISANGQAGISIVGASATGNRALGNFIGTDVNSLVSLGNNYAGVQISGGGGNQIGGTNTGDGNLISGNTLDGIALAGGTMTNLVLGNLIGVNAAGTSALHNSQNGISINGASANLVGGVVTGARNVISGNSFYGIYIVGVNGNVTGNVVQGNLIGLDVTGSQGIGNIVAGIGMDGAANNLIGGTNTSARNVVSANGNNGSTGLGGVFFANAGTSGNQLFGNYIGTDISGTQNLGNYNDGVTLEQSASGNFIGAAGAGNVISASAVDGIYLTSSTLNVIQGNFIGTKADGVSALGNSTHNVELQADANNNTIGGVTPGAGNSMAWAQSVYCGVRVRTGALNNLISGNSIFSNGALGIDLSPTSGGTSAGVNPIVNCESGIAASAANAGQNFPTLASAYSGTGTRVRGTLDAKANKSYALQFFASPSGDSSGYGEGQVYLGQTNLTLGASCSANFTAYLSANVPPSWVVTATATDANNNTSEFSAWIPVIPVPPLQIALSSSNQLSLS